MCGSGRGVFLHLLGGSYNRQRGTWVSTGAQVSAVMPCTSPFAAGVPAQVDVREDKLKGKKTWPEATRPVLSEIKERAFSMHSADERSSSTPPLLRV